MASELVQPKSLSSVQGALTDFDERLNQRLVEKASVARQIVESGWIKPGDKVFVALGTTCLSIAEALMRNHTHLHIVTHSTAVVRLYRELWSKGVIKRPNIKVEIVGGVIEPIMAYVKGERLGSLDTSKLILSPHSINESCIGGYDATPALEKLVKMGNHRDVIVAATYEKFGRPFANPIRHWGYMGSPKHWSFVFPDQVEPEGGRQFGHNPTAVEAVLNRIQKRRLSWLPGRLPDSWTKS